MAERPQGEFTAAVQFVTLVFLVFVVGTMAIAVIEKLNTICESIPACQEAEREPE
jgi:hypothetical protein